MDIEFKMDDKENIKAEANMWRFSFKDKQVVLKEGKYVPIISSDFQNIISNPKIEEICATVEMIIDYEEKIEKMKSLLKEQKLSQFHFSLDKKMNGETGINFTFSEFHIIFAAQTIASLTERLKQINDAQKNLVPQLLLNFESRTPSPSILQPGVAEDAAKIVLGKESKLSLCGELSNIVLVLPKSGLQNKERLARFSLTSKVELDLITQQGCSTMKANARIEEICLEIYKQKVLQDVLIQRTKIVFEFSDNSKEDGKESVMSVNLVVDPIKVHVAFSHIRFFAKKLAAIMSQLPTLKGASQESKFIQLEPVQESNIDTHNNISINAELKLMEFFLFDDSMENKTKFPWMQLELVRAGGKVEIEDKKMKGKASIGILKGTLSKQVTEPSFGNYITEFKAKHPKSIHPYMVLLELGFENMKADLTKDPEETIEFSAFLHRLYLKDLELKAKSTETNAEIVPVIASDFRDIISNPLIETTAKDHFHQLEIKLILNKKEENTKIDLLYSDFRVIVSPPFILTVMETMQSLDERMLKISKIFEIANDFLNDVEVKENKEEKEVILPTKKLKFSGTISNIEVWIPASIETNFTRVCQFSFTTKVEFGLAEESKDGRVLQRNLGASTKMSQLKLSILNKHQLKENEDIARLKQELVMLPSRLRVDVKRTEIINKNTEEMNVDVSIEPINITIGFRELLFFKVLAEYYQVNLMDKMPKLEFNKEEKIEEKKIDYNSSKVQVDMKMDTLTFLLVDDTGLIDQNLFKLLILNTDANVNMLTLLNEEERKTLYSDKDYLNVEGKFSIEALHYNLNVAEYEPVLESWGLNIDLTQYSIDQGKQIDIIATKMLNLNFSYAGTFLCIILSEQCIRNSS